MTCDVESPREAYYATLLSRGDRRVSRLFLGIHAAGGDWWRVIQEQRRAAHDERQCGAVGDAVGGAATRVAVDPDFYVLRAYAVDEILPWDFIDHSLHKRFLWVECTRAYAERQTMPCDVTTCRVCGAC